MTMTKSEIIYSAISCIVALALGFFTVFATLSPRIEDVNSRIDALNTRIDETNNKVHGLSQDILTIKNQVKVIVAAFPEKTIPILLSQQDLTPIYVSSYQYSSKKKLSDAALDSLKEIGITLKASGAIPAYKEPSSAEKVYYYDVKELMDVRNEQNKEIMKRKRGE